MTDATTAPLAPPPGISHATDQSPHHHDAPGASRRWWALAVMSLAQLLITVDVTIVNVALPQAQRSLGFSDASRQWVVTAYALAFGSLLLIGGRIADRIGRRRTLAIGLVLFGAGSAIGGAAPDFGILAAARTLQGVGVLQSGDHLVSAWPPGETPVESACQCDGAAGLPVPAVDPGISRLTLAGDRAGRRTRSPRFLPIRRQLPSIA